MNKVLQSSILFFVALALVIPAPAQTVLTTTTLSSAISTSSTRTVVVASASGITAGSTFLYVDRELLDVRAVSGTQLTVVRGASGTVGALHASGARVYVIPAGASMSRDRSGTCTAGSEYLPTFNFRTGEVFYCYGSLWVKGNPDDVGTPAAGVTAYEFSSGKHHTTVLSISGVTIGSPAGAASLAFGKLLYTLPAGAAVVKSTSLNIALDQTGGVVTADTPDVGVGTVVASGANALLSAAPAGSETILTGQTAADVNATATVKTLATVLAIEAADAHTVYLNVADGWAGADTVTGTGTVIIEWVSLH